MFGVWLRILGNGVDVGRWNSHDSPHHTTISKSCHNWGKAINGSGGPDVDRVREAIRVDWDGMPCGSPSGLKVIFCSEKFAIFEMFFCPEKWNMAAAYQRYCAIFCYFILFFTFLQLKRCNVSKKNMTSFSWLDTWNICRRSSMFFLHLGQKQQ